MILAVPLDTGRRQEQLLRRQAQPQKYRSPSRKEGISPAVEQSKAGQD
jgi:hypothetical protein